MLSRNTTQQYENTWLTNMWLTQHLGHTNVTEEQHRTVEHWLTTVEAYGSSHEHQYILNEQRQALIDLLTEEQQSVQTEHALTE